MIVSDPFLEECGCLGVLSEDGTVIEIQVLPTPPQPKLEDLFNPVLPETPAFHGMDDDNLGT